MMRVFVLFAFVQFVNSHKCYIYAYRSNCLISPDGNGEFYNSQKSLGKCCFSGIPLNLNPGESGKCECLKGCKL